MSTDAAPTITEFLLARITEEERHARAAVGDGRRWFVDGPAKESGLWWVVGAFIKFPERAAAEHIARHDPARVLAECAAKRAIIGTYEAVKANRNAEGSVQWHEERALLTSVRALAAIYSDRPDYQQKWAA